MSYRKPYSVEKTITKDMVHKKISGVCGGLAKHFGLPRIGVRLIAIIALISMPLITTVAYFVAAMLLPARRF